MGQSATNCFWFASTFFANLGSPVAMAAISGAPKCYTQSKRQIRVQGGSVTFNPSLTEAAPPVARAGWRRSVREGARPKV